jgi:hypothetical protein
MSEEYDFATTAKVDHYVWYCEKCFNYHEEYDYPKGAIFECDDCGARNYIVEVRDE